MKLNKFGFNFLTGRTLCIDARLTILHVNTTQICHFKAIREQFGDSAKLLPIKKKNPRLNKSIQLPHCDIRKLH